MSTIPNLAVAAFFICFFTSILFCRKDGAGAGTVVILFLTGWLNPKKMKESFKPKGILLMYGAYLSILVYIISKYYIE